MNHRWQIRQPAVLSKLRSSAQGLLRLLSATTAKSNRKLNRPTKGAHIKMKDFPNTLDEFRQ